MLSLNLSVFTRGLFLTPIEEQHPRYLVNSRGKFQPLSVNMDDFPEDSAGQTASNIGSLQEDADVKSVFFAAIHIADSRPDSSVKITRGSLKTFVQKLLDYYPSLADLQKPSPRRYEIAEPFVALLTCPACHKILEDPITLPCEEFGHSICKGCSDSIDDCPRCNSPISSLFVTRALVAQASPSLVIQKLLECFFPKIAEAHRIKKDGNKLFKADRYAEAITKYSRALEIGGEDAVIYSNRSTAYLRSGNPKEALQDAESAIRLAPEWAKAYFRKYSAIRETGDIRQILKAAFSALLMDRDIAQLREQLPELLWRFFASISGNDIGQGDDQNQGDIVLTLKQIDKKLDELSCLLTESRKELVKFGTADSLTAPVPENVPASVIEEHLTCPLCYRLMYKAATPYCGHSFCGECLHRVLDFKPSCPQCREDLSDYLAARIFSTTEILEKVAMQCLPELYEERKETHRQEMESVKQASQDANEVAVFVLNVSWPGVPFGLHVFEPRYRLMMRRAVESGSRLFGMCAYVDEEGGFADIGTMMRIEDIRYLEDGRCLVECVGDRRFKVLERGIRDGYNTAKFEYISDEQIPAHRLAEVEALQDTVYEKVTRWVANLGPARYGAIRENFGAFPEKPDLRTYHPDGPMWIWWIAALIANIRSSLYDLLIDTSLESRLRTISLTIDDVSARQFRRAT